MWRIALLCSVVTLTVACTDGPGAPTESTDGLSLQFGDPPPPPLDGGGSVRLFPSDDGFGPGAASIGATEIGTQQDDGCMPPVFNFIIEGDYFRNPTDNHARIHFRPVNGSGMGVIREKATDPTEPLDQTASGSIIVEATNTPGEEHRIHLVDYDGPTLFQPIRSVGFILMGELEAEVMACRERTDYTGFVDFAWSPPCPPGSKC
jgi:hypothetical protein